MPHTSQFQDLVRRYITEDRKSWLTADTKTLKHKELRERLEVFTQLRREVTSTFNKEQLEGDLYDHWSRIEDQWLDQLTDLLNRLYSLLNDKTQFDKIGKVNQVTLLEQDAALHTYKRP